MISHCESAHRVALRESLALVQVWEPLGLVKHVHMVHDSIKSAFVQAHGWQVGVQTRGAAKTGHVDRNHTKPIAHVNKALRCPTTAVFVNTMHEVYIPIH